MIRPRILFCLCLATVLAHTATVHAQSFRLPGVIDGNDSVSLVQAEQPFVAPEESFAPPGEEVIDPDRYFEGDGFSSGEPYTWQLLPQGLMYRSYLAGLKESRMYGGVEDAKDDSIFWSATLGARVGLLRYGTSDYILPDGFQIDAEASTQARLDVPNDVDLRSADYRGGVPVTFGFGQHRFRTGYYHLSSHLGDEFLLKNSGYDRLNFARDVILFGYSYYATPNLRFYAEAGWGFYTIVSDPWEFQFGIDYAPQYRTGFRGAPFFAINTHLKEELNYSGNFTVQAGWAWRADNGPQLLRIGMQYFNGASPQNSFVFENEQTIGAGVWYDF